MLCPWLTLMYCVKVENVWERQKYETIAWLVIGVVHDLNTLCGEDGFLSLAEFSIQWSLGDPYVVTLFCGVFVGIDELWVYDQIYLFISMKVFEFLWSLLCMIAYSLVFLLRYLGFVWPTWSIYLAMGRGALWWVRSYGAWSQWQKGNRHVCIIAIKDNKMGSIST